MLEEPQPDTILSGSARCRREAVIADRDGGRRNPCAASTWRPTFQSNGGLRSFLRHPGFAHGVEKVFGVLVPVSKTPDREARIECEAFLGFGLRLF